MLTDEIQEKIYVDVEGVPEFGLNIIAYRQHCIYSESEKMNWSYPRRNELFRRC